MSAARPAEHAGLSALVPRSSSSGWAGLARPDHPPADGQPLVGRFRRMDRRGGRSGGSGFRAGDSCGGNSGRRFTDPRHNVASPMAPITTTATATADGILTPR